MTRRWRASGSADAPTERDLKLTRPENVAAGGTPLERCAHGDNRDDLGWQDAATSASDVESSFALSPRYIDSTQLKELQSRPPVSFVVQNDRSGTTPRKVDQVLEGERANSNASPVALQQRARPTKPQSWHSPMRVPLAHRKLVDSPAVFKDDPPFGPIAPRPPSLPVRKAHGLATGSYKSPRATAKLDKLVVESNQTATRDQLVEGDFLQSLREKNQILYDRLIKKFQRLKRVAQCSLPSVSADTADLPLSGVEDAILLFLSERHRRDIVYLKQSNQASKPSSSARPMSLQLTAAANDIGRHMPYDLQRINEAPRDGGGDYYIMSSRALVHQVNTTKEGIAGEAISISQWVMESKMFSLLLAGIPLFQKFLVRKVFVRWRHAVRMLIFTSLRRQIHRVAPLARQAFSMPLLNSCHAMWKLQSMRALGLPKKRHAAPLSAVEEFHKEQLGVIESSLMDTKDALLGYLDTMVHTTLQNMNPSSSLEELYEIEASAIHTADMKWKSAPIASLNRRQSNIERKKSTAAADVELLTNYVRLVGYMYAESIYVMVLDSVRDMASELSADANIGVLCAAVTISSDTLRLSPTFEETKTVILEGVAKLIRLAGNFHFTKNAVDWSVSRGTGALAVVESSFAPDTASASFDLVETLRSHPRFDGAVHDLNNELSMWFRAASNQMEAFEPLRPIYAAVHAMRMSASSLTSTYIAENISRSYIVGGTQFTVDSTPLEVTSVTNMSGGEVARYLKSIVQRLDILDQSQSACQKIQSTYKVGFLEIQCRRSVSDILELIVLERDSVHRHLYHLVEVGIEECVSTLQRNSLVFDDRPQLVEYFCDQMKQVQGLKENERKLQQAIRNVDESTRVLRRYAPSLLTDNTLQYGLMNNLSMKYTTTIQAYGKFVAKMLPNINNQVNTALQKFSSRCQRLLRVYDEYSGISTEDDINRHTSMFQDMKRELVSIQEAARLYQEYQRMVGLKVMDVPLLDEAVRRWDEVQEIIGIIARWQNSVSQMDNEIFADQDWRSHVDNMRALRTVIGEYQQRFQGRFAPKLLGNVHVALDDFISKMSLILELAQPAIKPHHWQQVFALLGLSNYVSSAGILVTDGSTVTLGFLRTRHLWRYEAQVREITRLARHDDNTERTLETMKAKLAQTPLPLTRVGDNYEVDVRATTLLLDSLEDDLITIQSLAQVSTTSALQNRLVRWGHELRRYEEIIDAWLSVQENWSKLSEIFNLEYVEPTVHDAIFEFQAVSRKWKANMIAAKSASSLEACLTETITASFLNGCTAAFELLWGKLEFYLQEKRGACPRLYILSDKDLLDLLRASAKPDRLSATIWKCFGTIESLDIAEERSGPSSDETGEGVAALSTQQDHALDGDSRSDSIAIVGVNGSIPGELLRIKALQISSSIDVWITELDQLVKLSVQGCLDDLMCGSFSDLYSDQFMGLNRPANDATISSGENSVDTDASPPLYAEPERPNTMGFSSCPIHVILLCVSIMLTSELVPLVQLPRSSAAWQRFWHHFHDKRQNLVEFIRSRDSSPRERLIVINILTLMSNKMSGIDELFRDELSVSSGQYVQLQNARESTTATESTNGRPNGRATCCSFAWTKLARFYYDPTVRRCVIHHSVKSFEYGSTFLGNYSCPILSPMCDRVLLSMSAALAVEGGVLLHGRDAAGWGGKRTLVRELACTVGVDCVMYDFSGDVSLKLFSQILRGVLQAESLWLCCTGLEISPVTSLVRVFANLISRLKDVMRTKMDSFVIDQSPIAIYNDNLAIFVTTVTSSSPLLREREISLRLSNTFVPVVATHLDQRFMIETLLFVNGLRAWQLLSRRLNAFLHYCSNAAKPFSDVPLSSMATILAVSRSISLQDTAHDSEAVQPEEQDLVMVIWQEIHSKVQPQMRVPLLKCLRRFFHSAADLEIGVTGHLALSSHQTSSLTQDVSSSAAHSGGGDDLQALSALKHTVEEILISMNLVASESFVRKALEAYAVVSRRAITMVVGRGICGKSSLISVLSLVFAKKQGEALVQGTSSSSAKQSTRTVRLYPAAFHINDLFGEFKDDAGWVDGYLGHFFRQALGHDAAERLMLHTNGSSDGSSDSQSGHMSDPIPTISHRNSSSAGFEVPQFVPPSWLVLDGETDVATVMESFRDFARDSGGAAIKRIKLPNGDQLSWDHDLTRVLCEVASLRDWSPAILSQYGIVIVDAEHALPYTALIKSWANRGDSSQEGLGRGECAGTVIGIVAKVTRAHLPALLDVYKRHAIHATETSTMQIVSNMLQILRVLVDQYVEGVETRDELHKTTRDCKVLVALAAVMSIGNAIHPSGRSEFNVVAEIIAPNVKQEYPDVFSDSSTTLFDIGVCFDDGKLTLFRWMDIHWNCAAVSRTPTGLVGPMKDSAKEGHNFAIEELWSASKLDLSCIFVPTVEYLRCQAHLEMIAQAKLHAFVVGSSSVGKSRVLRNSLQKASALSRISSATIQIDRNTTGRDIQDAIESGMANKLRGMYCPAVGDKAYLLLLENLNLETMDECAGSTWRTRSCSGMVRQVQDGKGSFNKATKEFVEFRDMMLWCSYSLPAMEQTPLAARLLRHFHMICLSDQCTSVSEQLLPSLIPRFQARFGAILAESVESANQLCRFPVALLQRLRRLTNLASGRFYSPSDLIRVFRTFVGIGVQTAQTIAELERLVMHLTLQVYRKRLLKSADLTALDRAALRTARSLDFSADNIQRSERTEILLCTNTGDSDDIGAISAQTASRLVKTGEERLQWYRASAVKAAQLATPTALSAAPSNLESTSSPNPFREVALPSRLDPHKSNSPDISGRGNALDALNDGPSRRVSQITMAQLQERIAVPSTTQLRNTLGLFDLAHLGSRKLLLHGSDSPDHRRAAMIACGIHSLQFREVYRNPLSEAEFSFQLKTIVMETGLKAVSTLIFVECDDLSDAEFRLVAHLARQGDLPGHIYSSVDKIALVAFGRQNRSVVAPKTVAEAVTESSFRADVSRNGIQSKDNSRGHSHTVYRDNLRRCLHLVLSSRSRCRLTQIAAENPSVFYQSTVHYFPEWDRNSSEVAFADILGNWPLLAHILTTFKMDTENEMDDQVPFARLQTALINVYECGVTDARKYQAFAEVGRRFTATWWSWFEELLWNFKMLVSLHQPREEEKLQRLQIALRVLETGLSEVNDHLTRVQNSGNHLNDAAEAVTRSEAELSDLEAVERDAMKAFLLDEERCAKMQSEIEQERNAIQQELAKSLPDVIEATAALSQINKYHIVEMKSFTNPPQLVRLVMQAVCVLLGASPTWPEALRILADIRFIDRLRNFDKDRVDDALIERVRFYVNHPDFSVENMKRASVASTTLCKWVLALVRYFEAMKRVAPTQKKLERTELQFRIIDDAVTAERRKLIDLELQLNAARAKHSHNIKKELENQRAHDSRARWQDSVVAVQAVIQRCRSLVSARFQKQQESMQTLVGNACIVAALITFGAERTQRNRQTLVQQWRSILKASGVPHLSVPSILVSWSLSGERYANDSIREATDSDVGDQVEALEMSMFLLDCVEQLQDKLLLLVDPLSLGADWLKQRYDLLDTPPVNMRTGGTSTTDNRAPMKSVANCLLVLDACDEQLQAKIEQCAVMLSPPQILIENVSECEESVLATAVPLLNLIRSKGDNHVFCTVSVLGRANTWTPMLCSKFVVVNVAPTSTDLESHFLSMFYRFGTINVQLQRDYDLARAAVNTNVEKEDEVIQKLVATLCLVEESRRNEGNDVAYFLTSSRAKCNDVGHYDKQLVDQISNLLDEYARMRAVRVNSQEQLRSLVIERRSAWPFSRHAVGFVVAEEKMSSVDPLLSLGVAQTSLYVEDALHHAAANSSVHLEYTKSDLQQSPPTYQHELPRSSSSRQALSAQIQRAASVIARLVTIRFIQSRLVGLPVSLQRTYLFLLGLSLDLEGAVSDKVKSSRFRSEIFARVLGGDVTTKEPDASTSKSWSVEQMSRTLVQQIIDSASVRAQLVLTNRADSDQGDNTRMTPIPSDEICCAFSKIRTALTARENTKHTEALQIFFSELWTDMSVHCDKWKHYLRFPPKTIPHATSSQLDQDENAIGYRSTDQHQWPPFLVTGVTRSEMMAIHAALFGVVSLELVDSFILSQLGDDAVSQIFSGEPPIQMFARQSHIHTHVVVMTAPFEHTAAAVPEVQTCAAQHGVTGKHIVRFSLAAKYGGSIDSHRLASSTVCRASDEEVVRSRVNDLMERKDPSSRGIWAVVENALLGSRKATNLVRECVRRLLDTRSGRHHEVAMWLLHELDPVVVQQRNNLSRDRERGTPVQDNLLLLSSRRVFLDGESRSIVDLYRQFDYCKYEHTSEPVIAHSETTPSVLRRTSSLLAGSSSVWSKQLQHPGWGRERILAALCVFHSVYRLYNSDLRESEDSVPTDMSVSHVELERAMSLVQLFLHGRASASIVRAESGRSHSSDSLLSIAPVETDLDVIVNLVALIYTNRRWSATRERQCRQLLRWCFHITSNDQAKATTIETAGVVYPSLPSRITRLREQLINDSVSDLGRFGLPVELSCLPPTSQQQWCRHEASRLSQYVTSVPIEDRIVEDATNRHDSNNLSRRIALHTGKSIQCAFGRLAELVSMLPNRSCLSTRLHGQQKQRRAEMITSWGRRKTNAPPPHDQTSKPNDAPSSLPSQSMWTQELSDHLMNIELPAINEYLMSCWGLVDQLLALKNTYRVGTDSKLPSVVCAILEDVFNDVTPDQWRSQQCKSGGIGYPIPMRLCDWERWLSHSVAFYQHLQPATGMQWPFVVHFPALHYPRAFLETLRLSVAMAADVSFETVELQLAAIDAAETSTTHDEQQNVLASIPVSGLAVTHAAWSTELGALAEATTFEGDPITSVLPVVTLQAVTPQHSTSSSAPGLTYLCPLFSTCEQLRALIDPLARIAVPTVCYPDAHIANGVGLVLDGGHYS